MDILILFIKQFLAFHCKVYILESLLYTEMFNMRYTDN